MGGLVQTDGNDRAPWDLVCGEHRLVLGAGSRRRCLCRGDAEGQVVGSLATATQAGSDRDGVCASSLCCLIKTWGLSLRATGSHGRPWSCGRKRREQGKVPGARPAQAAFPCPSRWLRKDLSSSGGAAVGLDDGRDDGFEPDPVSAPGAVKLGGSVPGVAARASVLVLSLPCSCSRRPGFPSASPLLPPPCRMSRWPRFPSQAGGTICSLGSRGNLARIPLPGALVRVLSKPGSSTSPHGDLAFHVFPPGGPVCPCSFPFSKPIT